MKTFSAGEYVKQYGQDNYSKLIQTSPQVQQSAPNLFQRLQGAVNQAGDQAYAALAGKGEFAGQSTARRATGAVASAFGVFPGLATASLPEPVGTAITKGASNLFEWLGNNTGKNPFSFGSAPNSALSDDPIFQAAAEQGTQPGTPGYKLEETLGTISNLGGTAGSILFADQVNTGVLKTSDKLRNSLNTPVNTQAAASPVLDEQGIIDRFNRSIKPSTKNSAKQIQEYNSRIVKSVKAINENKDVLNLTDAYGEVIKGKNPETVHQLSQAIEQTKAHLFRRYDALAKESGKLGANVDASILAKELDPVINSKTLKIANPRAVEYATGLKERLVNAGRLNASDVQDLVQHYNSALEAFYKNPTYDTASTASIDAMVANKFRKALDAEISGATGQQYQALKDAYGSLATIEKDVAHRNVVWSRQNSVGLGSNLANIGSGVELARGLVTLNPADLAASATIKGLQKYIQYLNNPDVGIAKIFSTLEKSGPSSTATGILSGEPQIKGAYPQFSTKPVKVNRVPESPAPKTIPQDDLNVMSDFTDYVAKTYKPVASEVQQLELAASRIAERYGIPVGKSAKSMAKAFSNVLAKYNFKR